MNKKRLASEVSARCGLSYRQSYAALSALTEVVCEQLAVGRDVSIPGVCRLFVQLVPVEQRNKLLRNLGQHVEEPRYKVRCRVFDRVEEAMNAGIFEDVT